MSTVIVVVLLIAIVVAFVLALIGAVLSRFYRKVAQGQALIVNKMNDKLDVTFTGATVLPIIHKAETMDIGVKVIEVAKDGTDGLICRDNIRADIRVSFYIRVNPVKDDVLKVAKLLGTAQASNPQALYQLFSAKFAESLKTAGKQMLFVELYEKRELFRSNVIKVIGEDLNGYVLDDVAIEYLEQTPLAQLDPNNVLDAEGIRKITEITTLQGIETNMHKREAEKQIKAKDVETQQALFEMDRQEKAAEYRAARETATTKAREESTIAQVEAEERLKAEQARLRTAEQVQVQQENVQREVEVATKNRERVVAVEAEKVEKARQLEVVARDIETLAASKDLETEKARVAELAKARIAVEKTVAEQEESIKTLRVVEEANRSKESAVIQAGADAEAILITTIKEAEAKEKAAEHESRQRLIMAQAMREASDLESAAKIKLAEGVKAESAAQGLAAVEVKRAEAAAIEQVGVAQARVKEADAAAEAKRGEAEGQAMEARLKGEAAGLVEKAEAMKQLEGVGKEYDLAVRQIDAGTQVRLAAVEAQRDAQKASAEAMASALSNANVSIVGGADMFVDRIMGAAAAGRSIEAFATSSPAAEAIAKPYASGEKDLVELLSATVAGLGAGGLANLSIARVLGAAAERIGGNEGAQLLDVVRALDEKGLGAIDVARVLGSSSAR
jgi:uncharacterized membrane protein YqiK